MLIGIDIGNTNIVFGFFENNTLIDVFRFETKTLFISDEYENKFLNHLQVLNIKKENIKIAMITSVVPAANNILEEMFNHLHIKFLFIKNDFDLGLKLKLKHPEELGSDLLVGAYMAVKKYGCPCIIVDMGTAATYFAVNSQKEFLGGIITPGVSEAYRSLITATSLLENVRIEIPPHIIGNDTKTALQSGMVYGTIAMFNGLVAMLIEEMGETANVKVVLTGGLVKIIKPLLQNIIIDDYLILEGLNSIYHEIVNKTVK